MGSNENDPIAHCRNVRGLGKSVVVFRLFEKLGYSNERSTKFESIKQEYFKGLYGILQLLQGPHLEMGGGGGVHHLFKWC